MKKLRDTINEMKLMLNDEPTYTLENYLSENFILPNGLDGEEGGMGEPAPQEMPDQHQPTPGDKPAQENNVSGIEKELTQIRKIALNVITRLADQPSSEQYMLMKKIWNIVDKAIENGNEKVENI